MNGGLSVRWGQTSTQWVEARATITCGGGFSAYAGGLPLFCMGGQATDRRARYQAWQYAAKLLLDGADAEPLTTQIEYALTLDGHPRFR